MAENPVSVTNSLSDQNQGAVVFVHGFTGSAVETWEGFPELVKNDPTLGGYRFYFWGYPSELKLSYAVTKYFWEDDPEIETIGKALRTLLDHYTADAPRLTLVGHSMGGLVIQAFVLEEIGRRSHAHLDRLVEIVLYGTPSGGLGKAQWGSFLKNQISNMSDAGPFIRKLRDGWKQWIDDQRSVPDRLARFRLTVVAGLKDRFVPPESALTPFPFDEHEYTPGNHTDMVKPAVAGELPYRILKQRLLRGSLSAAERKLIQGESEEAVKQMNRVLAAAELGDVESLLDLSAGLLALTPSQVPRVERTLGLALVDYQQYPAAIDLLKRYLEFKMPDDGSRPFRHDAQAVQQLAVALSAQGDNTGAVAWLESLPADVRNLSETMGIRAGRLKRQWQKSPHMAMVGRRALTLYRTAYESARAAAMLDQVLYNGINTAYMSFALGDPYEDFAAEVLAACASKTESDYWTRATAAEAYLLLRRYSEALPAYQAAFNLAPVPRYLATTGEQALAIIERQGNPPAALPIREFVLSFLPILKAGTVPVEEG
jgi:tetratricopeptide (TPR) repeat protein